MSLHQKFEKKTFIASVFKVLKKSVKCEISQNTVFSNNFFSKISLMLFLMLQEQACSG